MTHRITVATSVAALSLAVAGTGLALAHAGVKSRYPAPGSRPTSVRTVRITFEEAVVTGRIASISGSSGFTSTLNARRTVLTARLKRPLAAGTHTVAWRVRADDGDSQTGRWRFTVR